MVYLFYTTNISADLAHHEITHAKVGKNGKRRLKSPFGLNLGFLLKLSGSFLHADSNS